MISDLWIYGNSETSKGGRTEEKPMSRPPRRQGFIFEWLGEIKWLMQRRNCVAWEIAEFDQPFKLANFHNFPFLSLSFLHFRSFVLRPPTLCLYISHCSLFRSCRQALSRLDLREYESA